MCFRLFFQHLHVLGIVYEWMSRSRMGDQFESNCFQKDRVENEKGPLGCYIIWNSVLERLG